MKGLILLFIFIAGATGSLAQSVNYSYDDAGNRISREIILTRSVDTMESVNPEIAKDLVSEREVLIYPNPTTGILRVEIPDIDSRDRCEMVVYSMSGQRIVSVILDSDGTEIDITSSPDGIYILSIIVNGESSSWKIIKK